MRLLHDRYAAYADDRCCDLVTGETMCLAEVQADKSGVPSEPESPGLAPLMEVLDHGFDGHPRCIVSMARNGPQAVAMGRRAAAGGRARGFVSMLVPLYLQFRDDLADELRDRTILLIGTLSSRARDARRALLDAASRSPRPHVLLMFRSAPGAATGLCVREARAVFGGELPRRAPVPRESPEVVRHVLRSRRAGEFTRSGRHAAAERLLRDVAGALIRREAHRPAAQTLVALGRLLLDRGQVHAADEILAQAVTSAEDGPRRAVGDRLPDLAGVGADRCRSAQ
jgi:hypothetical protein